MHPHLPPVPEVLVRQVHHLTREKPLSNLGKILYQGNWTHVLLTLFKGQTGEENIQILDVARWTGIKTEDIISTVQPTAAARPTRPAGQPADRDRSRTRQHFL